MCQPIGTVSLLPLVKCRSGSPGHKLYKFCLALNYLRSRRQRRLWRWRWRSQHAQFPGTGNETQTLTNPNPQRSSEQAQPSSTKSSEVKAKPKTEKEIYADTANKLTKTVPDSCRSGHSCIHAHAHTHPSKRYKIQMMLYLTRRREQLRNQIKNRVSIGALNRILNVRQLHFQLICLLSYYYLIVFMLVFCSAEGACYLNFNELLTWPATPSTAS